MAEPRTAPKLNVVLRPGVTKKVDTSATLTVAYFTTKPNNTYVIRACCLAQKGELIPTAAGYFEISAVVRTNAAGTAVLVEQTPIVAAQDSDHAAWTFVAALDDPRIDFNFANDDTDATWVRTWGEIVVLGEGGIHEYGDAANA